MNVVADRVCCEQMDFFQHRRYRIPKFLLGLVGQWPYQNKSKSYIFLGIGTTLCGLMITAQVRKLIIERHDTSIITEAIPAMLVEGICFVKILNCILNVNKICKLLQRVKADWNTPMGPEEKVLAQFADDGRTFTIMYTVWQYSTMVSFLSLPFAPKILVACGWANITATARFPFPVDYYVDNEENYAYIQVHICAAATFLITIIIAADVMFVVFVQHACGIFSAISYRLEHLLEYEDLNFDFYPELNIDEPFWIVVDCIKKHKEAVKFAELLNSTYCWSFFFVLGLNMAVLSFTGFQILTRMGELDEMIRQALFTIAQLVHLFFESYFSQRLTDNSLRVFEALLMVQWYKSSLRTRRLLNFMLMRSAKPCGVTAGKLYTMSMENFSAVVQTSASYFTILCSMQ